MKNKKRHKLLAQKLPSPPSSEQGWNWHSIHKLPPCPAGCCSDFLGPIVEQHILVLRTAIGLAFPLYLPLTVPTSLFITRQLLSSGL